MIRFSVNKYLTKKEKKQINVSHFYFTFKYSQSEKYLIKSKRKKILK